MRCQALRSARKEGGKKKKAKKGEDEDLSSGEEVSDSDEAVGAAPILLLWPSVSSTSCVACAVGLLENFSLPDTVVCSFGLQSLMCSTRGCTEGNCSMQPVEETNCAAAVQMSSWMLRSQTTMTWKGTPHTTTMTWRLHLR